jgi:hypothetical protein
MSTERDGSNNEHREGQVLQTCPRFLACPAVPFPYPRRVTRVVFCTLRVSALTVQTSL